MGTARAPEPGTASKQYGSAGALSDSANGRSMKGLSALGVPRFTISVNAVMRS